MFSRTPDISSRTPGWRPLLFRLDGKTGPISSPSRAKNCLFFSSPRSVPESTERTLRWEQKGLSSQCKSPGSEARTRAEVKKAWICTSIRTYTFTARWLVSEAQDQIYLAWLQIYYLLYTYIYRLLIHEITWVDVVTSCRAVPYRAIVTPYSLKEIQLVTPRALGSKILPRVLSDWERKIALLARTNTNSEVNIYCSTVTKLRICFYNFLHLNQGNKLRKFAASPLLFLG